MRYIFKFLSAALVCLLLSWGEAEARLIEIRVLHTTDLHGHLVPTTDYEGHTNVGGLFRCSTLIRQLRAERENVLLVDCGDLYQGTAESLLTGGQVMTKALAALKYDAWVLGNHEFDWGLDKMAARVGESTTPVLAANMQPIEDSANPMPSVRPYIIKEFEGVKVAIVGLVTPGVPSWSMPDQFEGLHFESSVDALRRIMPAVRAEKPDILLLATHQGYKPYGDDHANQINAIAQNFPEFDAIIGGHSHRVETSVNVKDAIFTQAGYYGNWLGCLDLSYDTVARKLVGKNARVLTVGDQYPPDPELSSLFSNEVQRGEAYLSQRVGRAQGDLKAGTDAKGRSPIQLLLCRAIAEASKAEIVMHGILAEEDLKAGDILMSDVWRIVPYENRIGTALLTPREIEDILNENLARRGKVQFMGVYGLDYEVEKDANGQLRVRDLRLADGSFLHPRKRFRVAFNSYTIASGGARFPRLHEIVIQPEARLELLTLDTRTAVLDYVKRHRTVSADSPPTNAAP